MYTPAYFRVTDRAILHGLMDRFSFATLVTTPDGGPIATHLPFLVYPDCSEHGTLIGHMARANQQWRDFARGDEALVIFQGPHAYISPSWYEEQSNVPTWNYAVVHAYGVPRVIDDKARVLDALRALADKDEAGFDEPWPMDLPDEYVRKMVQGIVAFEVPISRLEGKVKLSQNRSARDREGVVAALAASGNAIDHELAALTQESVEE